ncbi:hypothetical protein SteCoe_23438 [Stentor coeruleus]|uniref:AIG1-type G domain-containing protein n=1 Tax=Stentor coeruleus TaxID=5963 RepID=A0A1R2BJU7_9CILI|nr:hypothetical protein SteCoe_23438 [Stentor coeruleus]
MVNLGFTVIAFGPSQVSKSTFINYIAKSQVAKTGTGSGESTTNSACLYKINDSEITCLIDLPGLFDSRLKISDEAVLNMTKEKVLEARSSDSILKAFLVFESLDSELNKLKNTLAKLCSIFSSQVMSSIIVIASKSDSTKFPEKKVALNNYCSEKGLKLICWSNFVEMITEEQRILQENELIQAINEIPKVNADWIEELQNKINEKAQVLANQQIEPNETEINKKAQEIADNAPDIEVIKYKETTRPVQRWADHGRWVRSGGFLGRIRGKERWESNWVAYTAYEPFSEPYTELEKPKYTVFIEEAKKILAPKPPEFFYAQAASLVAQEIKKILASDSL